MTTFKNLNSFAKIAKTVLLIVPFALSACGGGGNDEPSTPSTPTTPSTQSITITAVRPSYPSASSATAFQPKWASGDQIAVVDTKNNKKAVLTLTSGADSQTGIFTGTMDLADAADIEVVYPAADVTSDAKSITFSYKTQNLSSNKDNSYINKNCLLTGTATYSKTGTTSVKLASNSTCIAGFDLKVPADDKIKSLILSEENADALWLGNTTYSLTSANGTIESDALTVNYSTPVSVTKNNSYHFDAVCMTQQRMGPLYVRLVSTSGKQYTSLIYLNGKTSGTDNSLNENGKAVNFTGTMQEVSITRRGDSKVNTDWPTWRIYGTDEDYQTRAATALKAATSKITVILPEATQIYANAFKDCSNLYEVSCPLVTSIGENAFEKTGLTSLNAKQFPVLSSIGQYAFYMSGIMDIDLLTLPGKLAIGDHAFNGCANLTVAKANPTSLGSLIFLTCDKLVTIKFLSSSFTSVSTDVFTNMNNAKNCTLYLNDNQSLDKKFTGNFVYVYYWYPVSGTTVNLSSIGVIMKGSTYFKQ